MANTAENFSNPDSRDSDFTFIYYDRLAHRAGFAKTGWQPLAGPTSG